MKRSGFKRPQVERKPQPLYCAAGFRQGATIDAEARQAPKTEIVRSEAYRRLVAALPCAMCGLHGFSQAAHPNTGKGAGMKADDRLCFPLCADRYGVRGCHSLFDQGAAFTKEQRREVETRFAAQTMIEISARGMWPPGLPAYAWGST